MFSSSVTFRLMTTSRLFLIISGDISDFCAFLQSYALSASFLLSRGRKKNISQALHLLCLSKETTLTQTLHRLRHAYNAVLYTARAVLSHQQDKLRDSRQPIYSILLSWGLITMSIKTEINRQFICSSQPHLNTNHGFEWWIKYILYQILFIPTGDNQNN